MLLSHTRGIHSTREKAEAALAFLSVVPGSAEMHGEPALMLVDRLRHDLENVEDPVTYLAHEYLVDANQPLYFSEFVGRIEAMGLQYVDDAFPGSTALARLPPAARQWVTETQDDVVEQQQYLDFMCNVSFRRSLLCREMHTIQRVPTLESMQPLQVRATCRRAETQGDGVGFRTDPGRFFSVDHPGLVRMLTALIDACPASMPLVQLRAMLDIPDDEVVQTMCGMLGNAAIEFTTHPAPCTRQLGEFPFASRLVRQQAVDGIVTNAAHRPVRLDDVCERHLLTLLDGTRNVAELVSLLRERVTPDKPIDHEQWDKLIRDRLERFVKRGLLADPGSA